MNQLIPLFINISNVKQGLGRFVDNLVMQEFSEENLKELMNELFKFLIDNNIALEIVTLIISMLTVKLLSEKHKFRRFSSTEARTKLVKDQLKILLHDTLTQRELVGGFIEKLKQLKQSKGMNQFPFYLWELME